MVLLVLIPATNAIQTQSVENENLSLLPATDSMTLHQLAAFVAAHAADYPELAQKVQKCVREIDATLGSSQAPEDHSTLRPQTVPDNQTLLEKIYWKMFNYRVARLYLSVYVYLVSPSNFSMLRVTTWGIKLLRITKVGILLGFISSNPQQPQQPTISFLQDTTNKTLTVVSAYPEGLLWNDIDQVGSGSCDPLPTGTVAQGDQITNCTGIIILRYLPENLILGFFQFD
jgi:hypothetical protein